MITDPKGLKLRGGEGLCCNGDPEGLDGTVIGIGGGVEVTHGDGSCGGGGVAAEARVDWILNN
jgi:hypothetical protein